MKTYLAYRFTGENREKLKVTLNKICSALGKGDTNPYCSFWDIPYFEENKFSNGDVIQYTFEKINKVDLFLAYIKSENKSEGMLLEIGYAKAKGKKIIAAIKKGIQTTYIGEIADKTIYFDTLEDLCEKLGDLNTKVLSNE